MNYLLNWFLVKLGHHRAIFRGKTFHCLAPRDGGVWIFFRDTGSSQRLLWANESIQVLSIFASEKAHDVCILVRNLETGNMEVLLTRAPYDPEQISTITLGPDSAEQSRCRLARIGEELLAYAPNCSPWFVALLYKDGQAVRKDGRVAR